MASGCLPEGIESNNTIRFTHAKRLDRTKVLFMRQCRADGLLTSTIMLVSPFFDESEKFE